MTTISLTFSVNVITSLGQQVFICGNIAELGSWNPSNALKLITTKDLYPEWKNRKPLTIHPNISLEFKLFIKNSHGGEIRWEKIQDNRKFVPIESVLVVFSEGKEDMTFETVFTEEQMQIRKNTFDIIRDLSDEVSESSSGNQKQFWQERRSRDRGTLSSSKEFVADAKIIFDTWIPNRVRNYPKIVNQWAQIISTVHIIVKKQYQEPESQLVIQSDSQIPKNSKNLTVTITKFKINKKSNNVDLKKYPQDMLKIFHIEDEAENQNWAREAMKAIKNSQQGFYVIYLKNQQKPVDEYLIDKAEMIIVKSKQLLKESLQRFHIRKNHSVSMIKENQFLIKKNNNDSIIVLYEPNLQILNEEFSKNNEYFSGIQKILMNQRRFRLPQNMKLSQMIEKNVVRHVRENKFCLVLLCQKLSDIPQKIITKLIRISSCPNVSINVMTGDEIQEIFLKLPVSEKDKLLVYNRSGQVFKPGKKPANIYDSIHITNKKYQQVFKHLKEKAKFWIVNREIQVIESNFSLQFVCERNVIGQVISQSLANEFSNSDEHRKYPFQVQKYVSEDQKNIIIHIRPVLSSTDFYSTIITSISMSPPMKTYFFNFDYTGDKYRFIQKMERSAHEKHGISDGFIMADSSGRKGLTTEKFDQFLTILLNEAYYSIIESDLDEATHSRNKKQKEVIRSDKIN